MPNYAKAANDARKKVLEMIFHGGVSHIGSNFSSIDLLTVLFEKTDLNRDKILFSKGCVAASAYYFLSKKGIIPKQDLEKFCDGESPYIGLVEPTIKGIWAAGGSMSYGLPFGTAFAWDKKNKDEDGNIYILMSDGEQAMGQNYEAARVASHYKLDNLTAIIDYNKLCGMGKTNEILNIEPLSDYWKSLGWDIVEIDGHNYKEIETALAIRGGGGLNKPYVIIAHTIKGKGISFMEGNNDWHYRHLDEETYNKAL